MRNVYVFLPRPRKNITSHRNIFYNTVCPEKKRNTLFTSREVDPTCDNFLPKFANKSYTLNGLKFQKFIEIFPKNGSSPLRGAIFNGLCFSRPHLGLVEVTNVPCPAGHHRTSFLARRNNAVRQLRYHQRDVIRFVRKGIFRTIF